MKYKSPKYCMDALKYISESRVSWRAMPSTSRIIDLELGKMLASQKFLCDRTNMDLSCVPIEYLIPTKD